MPKIVKQSPSPSSVSKRGVLDRILPVAEDKDGIRLLVYGRGKTGKTRLGCTFPAPVLIMGTEKGTKSVVGQKQLDFVRLQASGELDDIVAMLKGAGKYRSVVLDTAGGLQDLILKEILGLEDIPIQRTWGLATRDQWMICGMQLKELLRRLLELTETHGINVVTIAHERNFTEDGGGSDVMLPSIGASLTPSATNWLNGACDYICQTYIRERLVTRDVTLNGKTQKSTIKDGSKEYCLRVGPHHIFMTGFRLPEGMTLPDSIVDPSYEKIYKLIKGVK